MRLRRVALGALAALAVVAVVGVWPAEAATSITVDAPVNDAVWSGAATTDFHVTGHANTSGGYNVAAVDVKVEPNDGGTHTYDPPAQTFAANKTAENFETIVFPDFNGKYKVSAVATGRSCGILGCQDQVSGTIVRTITVAVAPKVPTGVKVSQTDGKAAFEWGANNTEGDLLGYFVERQAPGSTTYSCIAAIKADPDAATYKINDDIKSLNSGDVRYRVRAARALNSETTMGTCAAPGEAIASAASASVKVAWVNPTATTTSTTTPGGGGGGGGTGGSTTSTTRPKSSTGSAAGSKTSNPSSAPNLSALGSLGGTTNLARPSTLRPGEIDNGFNELLPFQSGAPGSTDDNNSAASAQTPLNGADDGNGQTTTLLFIAAGLLATVLSMHVLWLKAQVDRTPLEPLAPQDIAVL